MRRKKKRKRMRRKKKAEKIAQKKKAEKNAQKKKGKECAKKVQNVGLFDNLNFSMRKVSGSASTFTSTLDFVLEITQTSYTHKSGEG